MMHRSVVTQQHPYRRIKLMGWALLAIVLSFLLGTMAGRYKSLDVYLSLIADNRALRVALESERSESSELHQQLETWATRTKVSADTLARLRSELAGQREQIGELQQGLGFYRNLMSADGQAKGLSVSSIGIAPGYDGDVFQFRILVQQNARKHGMLSGRLAVELVGEQAGKSATYNLSKLSAELPTGGLELRFKYFQAIEGELRLPEGFVPRKMVAYVSASKPPQEESRKDFPWVVQEKISYVGQ